MPCSRSRHRARKPTLRKPETGAQSSSAEDVRHSLQGSARKSGGRYASILRPQRSRSRPCRSERSRPLQLETLMKSENAQRNVATDNDPAIRNPFGVMDVPNPNDDDVTQYARNTTPEKSAADENAKPWSAGDISDPHGTIEGQWSSRW